MELVPGVLSLVAPGAGARDEVVRSGTDGQGAASSGPDRGWTNVAWRGFMWGLTIVGEDSLCTYGQLQVWSRSGAVNANLDFSDSMVWAKDPEEEFRVQLKWPKILVPGTAHWLCIRPDQRKRKMRRIGLAA